MRFIRVSILVLLLGALSYFSIHLFQSESEKRVLKEDLIELSKVKYGMFNVEAWKQVITGILAKKIAEYSIDGSGDEGLLREKIDAFLAEAIDRYEKRFKEANNKRSLGFLLNVGSDVFEVFELLKKDIPIFREHVLSLIERPENQADLHEFMVKQLNTYANETDIVTNYSRLDSILLKYEMKEVAPTKILLEDKIKETIALQTTDRDILFILIGVTLLLVLAYRKPTQHEFLVLSIMALVLLTLGVLLPMISIDARVEEMRFILAGEPVTFENQVLYFKSKSILEVVQLMLGQPQIELIGVGLLVLLFSVIFPVVKLGASVVYLYVGKWRQKGLLKFLVFKTAKWSMADVMVVTLMMTYLGFGSIVGEQLKQLDSTPEQVDIITTGYSSLEVGFYLFLGFVLLSLLISHRMQYSLRK